MTYTSLKISLSSELLSLRLADEFVKQVCAARKVEDAKYGDILVSVSEAVTNAIHYGHSPERARLILLEYVLQENNVLKFIISDTGNGFDFENVPDPTDPVNIEKEGGRGVFIMRKLADRCTFNKNGSEVVLEFDLGLSFM
jgi:serine/threonine-protein kinase RsbW